MTGDISINPSEPDDAPRIAVMDILRGIAILGILFMNIADMGQSFHASTADIMHLGWGGWDQLAWWLREVLANGTTRGLLEMLFGAGMVILTDRIATRVGEQALLRRYYVRNMVLFLLGVVHMYVLLWPGDILHSYGLAALIAVFARAWQPRWLLAAGMMMAALQLSFGGYFDYYQAKVWTAEVTAVEQRVLAGEAINPAERTLLDDARGRRARDAKRATEASAQIAAEDRGRRGDTRSWVTTQIEVSRSRFPAAMEIFVVWEALGTMLIGAALFKLGVIQGRRSHRFYLIMTLVAYEVAIPLRLIGAWEQASLAEGPHITVFTVETARLLMTLGHVGLVNLLIVRASGLQLLRPFEAAGKTALSVYVAQTLITLWLLFPPFGLHLYGQLTWAPLMVLALAINLALLMLANLYLRYLDIGPVEWLWRSLIAWRALPWRKG